MQQKASLEFSDENSSSSKFISATNIIRSDGGNANDNSVANPNINIPRPQVKAM